MELKNMLRRWLGVDALERDIRATVRASQCDPDVLPAVADALATLIGGKPVSDRLKMHPLLPALIWYARRNPRTAGPYNPGPARSGQ